MKEELVMALTILSAFSLEMTLILTLPSLLILKILRVAILIVKVPNVSATCPLDLITLSLKL